MNADQRANLQSGVDAVAESFVSAWSYFHLLEGLHEGSKAHPDVTKDFALLFTEIWRSAFEGLLAKAGTLIDNTKNTHSLPNLITLAKRYADPELKPLLKELQAALSAANGPLNKIQSWRHEVVAHKTNAGRLDTFYIENKMNLNEVHETLLQLEATLNRIAMETVSMHIEMKSASARVSSEGSRLFAALARSVNVTPAAE